MQIHEGSQPHHTMEAHAYFIFWKTVLNLFHQQIVAIQT